MFSYFKVIYQINRCTFKNKIKSHVFLQCAHSDFFFLHQSLCFTYSHSLQHFFYSNGTYIKWCTFKKRLKSHIFSFKSAPCQIFFIFAWKFFRYLRTQFSIFSSFKGTYQRKKCTFKKMVKYHIFFFLQCALSGFFIFASKLLFYLLKQLTIISFFKGTN